MIYKLALSGVRYRWKDYLILFSGLSIGTAIFYMFSALAMNPVFLKANIGISLISQVFYFGVILLTLITMVYVIYAQSFLMGMRYKDYGMFLMLGAKNSKISQLIIVETLTVHIISTIFGVFLGMGLTKVASQWLANQINFSLKNLTVINLSAILLTIAVFVSLALICAVGSVFQVVRKPLSQILKMNQATEIPKNISIKQFGEVIIGIMLLVTGFYFMFEIDHFQLLSLPIALFTISFGTYFIIHSIFSVVLNFLRKSKFGFHQLRLFTLGQLQFRISSYTKVLAMVSILFALALGSITVGMGYQRQIPLISSHYSAYSMNLTNPNKRAKEIINKLDLAKKVVYEQKSDKTTVYFKNSQLTSAPYQEVKKGSSDMSQLKKTEYQNVSVSALEENRQRLTSFMSLQNANQQNKRVKFISDQEFAKLNLQNNRLYLIRVKNLSNSFHELTELNKSRTNIVGGSLVLANSYDMYVLSNTMFGGLEFVGLFLGIAFLTMLASCMMFKVLSGAKVDQRRYTMLNKIGVSMRQLKNSISKEIAVLFLIPAVIGIAYVGLGLQMFKKLMIDPYDHWYLPVLGFIICYGIYYGLTVIIYRSLVIPKQKR